LSGSGRDSGVTIVNVHSGQPDQARVIDFYGTRVLPTGMVFRDRNGFGCTHTRPHP
jgi:hypothetical protein